MPRHVVLVIGLVLAGCGSDSDKTTLTGTNGEKVTIETAKDGGGTTRLEATNEKGEKVTASFDAEGSVWPTDAPAYAAAYPGAKPTNVMSSESGGTKGSIVGFETTDTAAQVVAHYKALATKAGLGEASTITSGATSLFTAADKAGGREFMVQATTAEGKTQGSVTFSTKSAG